MDSIDWTYCYTNEMNHEKMIKASKGRECSDFEGSYELDISST